MAATTGPEGVNLSEENKPESNPTEMAGATRSADTATNTMVATIPVGVSPFGVAITPAPQAPNSKQECTHGEHKKFGPPAGPFKNQGQCVSCVEHNPSH